MGDHDTTPIIAIILLNMLTVITLACVGALGAEPDSLPDARRAANAVRAARLQVQTEVDAAKIAELSAPAPEATPNPAELPPGMAAEYAGRFNCTAYCTELYPHICGNGTGITASGALITPGLTVGANPDVLPYGTVVYIAGLGVFVVQDTGPGCPANHIDVAVPGTHADALQWTGQGTHDVWVLR